MSLPPDEVKQAFAVDGDVEMLAGGYETSVRVGDAVLKRVMDLDVALFCQAALSQIAPQRIIVPTPLRTTTGEWSVGGWIASTYIHGLTPARHDPALLVRTGHDLAAALAAGGSFGSDGAVRARNDRWAVAERFAFEELDLSLGRETHRVVEQLRSRITEDDAGEKQLIHADLAGNVFIDPSGTPVVLDFTPAFRSTDFQAGVIVADTLLWGDEDVEHVALLEGDTSSLARGLLFRLIAAELAEGEHNADLARCERVLADLA